LSPHDSSSDSRLEVIVDGFPMIVRVHSLRRSAADRERRAPRLRFDRVVRRVCDELGAVAAPLLPVGSMAVVTLQAPIRLASKTVASIEAMLRILAAGGPTGRTRSSTLFGNRIRVGIMQAPLLARSRLVCLVHTDDADAARLRTMTQELLALVALPAPAAGKGWLVVATPERSQLLPVYRHILSQLGVGLPYRAALMVFSDGKTGFLPG
jgi:hypothetical protein